MFRYIIIFVLLVTTRSSPAVTVDTQDVKTTSAVKTENTVEDAKITALALKVAWAVWGLGMLAGLIPLILVRRRKRPWRILSAPGRAFQEVAEQPDWLVPFLLISVSGLIMSAPSMDSWFIKDISRSMVPRGESQALDRASMILAPLMTFSITPIVVSFIWVFRAGSIWILAWITRERTQLSSLLSVVGYAYLPELIGGVVIACGDRFGAVSLPLSVKDGPMGVMFTRPTSFGGALDLTVENNPIGAFLWQIELFGLWSLILTAIGVRRVYDIRMRKATLICAAYLVLLLVGYGCVTLLSEKQLVPIVLIASFVPIVGVPMLIFKQHRKLVELQAQLLKAMEKELQTAHDMQMGLMPTESPKISGFDITGRCIPANHVGGDFFQYFPISDNRLAISLADVTGHAMEAAVPVMMFSGILDTQMEAGESLEELFGKLNRSLCRNLADRRTYVCFTMGELDTSNRRFRLSNGGCPYPYHFRASTSEITELQVDAYPLGVRIETTYPVIETQLGPGDRIVFCSDGIIEAENSERELFGFERTAETIRNGCQKDLTAPQLLDYLINEVKTFSGDTPQGDDQTVVVLAVVD